MSIGGNVKVTLTLDDSGFTVKTQKAAKSIQEMNAGFKEMASGLKSAESQTKAMAEQVEVVSKSFNSLSAASKNTSKALGSLASTGTTLDKTTSTLIASFASLQSVVAKFGSKLTSATDGMGKTSTSANNLSKANKELSSSTAAAADGMTRQERAAKNLGAATTQAVAQIKLSALASKDAAAAQMASEFSKNQQLLANKKSALASMLRAEQQYQRSLEEAKAKAMASQMSIESRRGTNGKFVGANSDYMNNLRQQLQLELQQVAALEKSVSLIGLEAQKMQSTVTTTQQRNAALQEGISLRERDLANVQRYRQALQEGNQTILNAERQKRAEIAQQNQQIREQLSMVKSLGQVWAAMKIYQGEKASVQDAGDYERTLIRARAMGVDDAGMEQFKIDNKRDSESKRGVSYNDAAEARIAVMGGIASKREDQVEPLVSPLIDAVKNIQFITKDSSQETFKNLSQNLIGFIDARQQQYRPEEAKKTMNLVTQTSAATGGKIDIQDFETLSRRIGSANQISDEGWMNLMAMAEQYKVSGGGGGGGAGGLSTVGTMTKMLTAYGMGKTKTNQSVQQLVEAGILDTSGADPHKSYATQVKFLKNAGFKDQKTLMTDPTTAFMNIAKAAQTAMTSSPKQIEKYYGSKDANINDPDLKRSAMQKWATRMGYSTTASTMLSLAGDERFQERVHHTTSMIKGAQTNAELTPERTKSYQGTLDAFNASTNNLKITLGTMLLPILTKVFNGFNTIVIAANDFAKNNPLVSTLTMIASGFGSLYLSIKGFMSMMGLVTKSGEAFGLFGSKADTASKIASSSVKQSVRFILGPLSMLKEGLLGVKEAGKIWSTTMASSNTAMMNSSTKALPLLGTMFRTLGTTIGATFKFIGKAFLKMLPFVGWLLIAWDLGGLLLNIQVGGAKISEWLLNWMDGLWVKAQEWWAKFTGLFKNDASKATTDAAIDQIKKEQEARSKAFEGKRQENLKQIAEKKEADEKNAQNVQNNVNGVTTDDPNNATSPYGPPVDWGDGGDGGNGKRGFEDPFVSSLAEMRRKATIDAQKAGAAIAETGNDLSSEARIAFKEKWIAGDFDPGHDPKKRQFKGSNGDVEWSAKGAGGQTPQDWVDQYVEMKRAEDQLKSMQFVKQRVVATEEDYRNAMERTSGETGKQNRDLAALERELARAGERLKTGTEGWAAWTAEKNRALETKAGATLVNFAADFAESDKDSQASLMPDGFSKKTSAIDNTIKNDREQYEQLRASHKDYYDKEIAAYKEQLATREIDNNTYTQKATSATERYTEAAKKAETAYTQHVQIQTQLRARESETATAKQAREWQNTYSALDTASANWSNSFISNLQTMLEGGKVSWKSFLAGMLSDLLNMKLKETFGKAVNGMFGGLSSMLNGTLFNNSSSAGSGSSITNGLSTAWNGVSSLWGGSGTGTGTTAGGETGGVGGSNTGSNAETSANATEGMTKATTAATSALSNMSSTGIGGAITSLISWVASLLTGTAASTTKAASDEIGSFAATSLTTALFEATLALTNFSIALTASATTSTATSAFANGGIMTSGGSMPLMKYANGGVANKPQLALFGEGRMNEAYVPLPDGRSIPVTMKGDAGVTNTAGGNSIATSVQVSVSMSGSGQANTESSSSSGDNVGRAWGSVLQTAINEQIEQAIRPGGMIYLANKSK